MAILPIRTYPDPVLSVPCGEIKGLNPELIQLGDSMTETLVDSANGIGLAAPQVGQSVSLVVVDKSPGQEKPSPLCLFNPRIVEMSGEEVREEGCLSLPDYFTEVTRATQVVLHALDRDGRPIEIKAEGILARCLQHELDHLQGKLLVDHVSPLKRAIYRKRRLKELKQEGQ
ncbi:MAG: peptide deformylase [Desulfarculaceae bacterium]|jgi:peptide deformylase